MVWKMESKGDQPSLFIGPYWAWVDSTKWNFLFLIRWWSSENKSFSICWTYFPQISFIYLLLMPPLNGEGLMETNCSKGGLVRLWSVTRSEMELYREHFIFCRIQLSDNHSTKIGGNFQSLGGFFASFEMMGKISVIAVVMSQMSIWNVCRNY